MLLSKLKIPHVFTLLTGVIFVCSLLTYVIPSGSFERETKEIGGTTRTLVVPGSYERHEKHFSVTGMLVGDEVEGKTTPVSLTGFLSSIPRGMESAADIIFFIFILGGVFGILQKTGVILGGVQKLLDMFEGNGNLLTILLVVVLAIGGSTLGMGEEFIPLVPIFLVVSKRLGYDRIYGMAIVILAAQVGFAAATTNPFNVVIAQGIAGIQPYSGMGFRVAFFVVAIGLTLTHLLRYGAKIRRDPNNSLMAHDDFDIDESHLEHFEFTKRHVYIMIMGGALFLLILYAVQTQGWWMAEMAGGFILIGILAALISDMSLDDATKAFVKGMEEMLVAALVVGFAKGIQVVLVDGQVMDTVIHAASSLLDKVPAYVSVQGMLLFQTFLNFFIPSGSGQAAVTMPVMAPIADVIGVTRQTAVFAFQCGDGFSNTIIPTSGILMSMLALAKIPYETWLKFMLPLFLQLLAASGIFLVIAVLTGYQ